MRRLRFTADAAIKSRKQDLLGRRRFAEQLAAGIAAWKGEQSLVVAVYGPWGSGKSSVKNMLLETLKEDLEGSKSAVLEFNPWQWSGHNQLSEGFFAELGRVIGKFDGRAIKIWKHRALRLRLYASYLNVAAFGVRSWEKALSFFLGSGAIVLLGNSSFVADSAFKWIPLAVGIVGLFVSGFKLFSDLFESAAEAYLRRVEYRSKSVTEVKAALARAFEELQAPVLVVLDDIDRLSGEEIRCVFQLVKANANFPNLVYLLLFERDKVEASLSEGTEHHFGREYLAKVVQVGFDLGAIERPTLYNLLKAETDELFSISRGPWDRDRWFAMFDDFASLFRNLRDVYRFLGTAAFYSGLFREVDTLQVDAADLLTLEALRVLQPAVYHKIPSFKEPLLGQGAFKEEEQKEEREKAIQSLCELATGDNRMSVKGILESLFPLPRSGEEYDRWTERGRF